MTRALIGHAVLLVGALGLAFAVWTGDKSKGDDEAPVLVALAVEQLASLRYTWPEGETQLTPVGAGEDRSYRVHLTRRTAVKKPAASQPATLPATSQPAAVDGGAAEDAGAAPAVEEIKVETSSFPAGATVAQALEKLAPLTALRSLGRVDGAQLTRMGLDQPARVLEVQAGARSYTLEIGDKTYGAQGHYARLRGQAEVVLIASAVVNGLEGAESKLMEWRLAPVEVEAIAALELRSGPRTTRLLHVDREQPQKRHFALASSPEQKSDEAEGLVNRLRGLRASLYLEQAPAPGAASEAVTFVVQRAQGQPLQISLLELGDGSGYLARSGTWIAEVSAAQARGLIDDAAALLGP
jgi:hypothetical protein